MESFWDAYRLERAAGGYLNHYRLRGTSSAACGFTPKAVVFGGGRQMKQRHGWTGQRGGFGLCSKCKERTDQDYRKVLLDDAMDPPQ